MAILLTRLAAALALEVGQLGGLRGLGEAVIRGVMPRLR